MSDKKAIIPSELLEFFNQLDPGGADEECELHYGCSCVIHKGLEAARMLHAIHQMLGGGAAAPVSAGSDQGSTEAVLSDDVEADIKEARAEIDRLIGQNMDLTKQNKALKDRLQSLQKQIERLYNKREMASTLNRLESKTLTKVEKVASDDEDTVEDKSDAEVNKEFAEDLAIEAAAPIPPEEKEKKEAEAKDS